MHKSDLIVVAHPDDEAIWFSSILSKRDCNVCFCFQNKYPENKEENLSYSTNVFEIIRGYKDIAPIIWLQTIKTTSPRIFGEIDARTEFHLRQNLDSIISITSPKRIYTHNPLGEYGHSEHILIHKLLSKEWKNLLLFPSYGIKLDSMNNNIFVAEKNNVDLKFREKLFLKYKKRGIWTGGNGEPYGDTEIFYRYK